MNKYIVYFAELDCKNGDLENLLAIVNANNKEEASNKFLTNYVVNQENFTDDVISFNTFNYGLFEEGTGELYPQYTDEIASEIIKNRIREFCKGTDFADVFIEAVFNYNEDTNLPTEALVHYLKNDKDYAGDIIVKNINDIIIS